MTQCNSGFTGILWLLVEYKPKMELKDCCSDSGEEVIVAWTRVVTVQVIRSESGCSYTLRIERTKLSVHNTNYSRN